MLIISNINAEIIFLNNSNNNNNNNSEDFVVPVNHRVELKESEKKKKKVSTRTLLEKWKTREHESNGDTKCNLYARYCHQRIGKGTGGLGNKRMSGDQPN